MAKSSIFDNITFDNEADDLTQIRIIQVGPFINEETDPLGTTIDAPRPSFFNLNRVVFAEPVRIDQSAGFNDEDSTADCFFDETNSDHSSKSKDETKEETESNPPLPHNIKTDNKIKVKKKTIRRRKAESADDVGPHICAEASCRRELASAKRLREHIRKVHCADGGRYPCAECDKAFPLRYLLARHQIVHRSAKRQCPVCRKMLSLRNSLSLHMRSHAGLKPFTCLACGKSFTRQSGLNAHSRFVHPSEGSLSCRRCGLSFPRRADLTRHQLAEHAPPRRLECHSCGRHFSNRAALGAHRAKRHEAYDASLDKLWRASKADTTQGIKSSIGAETGKTETSKLELGNRELIKNGNGEVEATPINVAVEEDIAVKLANDATLQDGSKVCESCGAVFPKRSALIQHISIHLPPSGGAHCQLCNTWQREARAHYDAWHAPGVRRTTVHRCGVCARGFARNCLLVRHMAVHTGSRPYQCHACSRGFACGSKLRAHLRAAHGQRAAPDSDARPAALVAQEMREGLADGSKAVVRHEGRIVGFKTVVPRSFEDADDPPEIQKKSKRKKKRKRPKENSLTQVKPFVLDVKPILANITVIPAVDRMEVVEGSGLKVVASENNGNKHRERSCELERAKNADIKKEHRS